MALKTVEYKVDLAGITPATEQFGGTQGDHRATMVEFVTDDLLKDEVTDYANEINGKAMYRFDVYDGEGGIWSSESKELKDYTLGMELEERHTRHGGKVTIYLVLTVLSSDGETEIELYSFPAVLRLSNRPDGTYQDGENRDSVSGLAEVAKANAESAASYSALAQAAESSARQFAAEVEQKLANGEFDGKDGTSVTHSFDGTVLKMTSASGTTEIDLKGDKGDTGPQGEKGDKGDTPDVSGFVKKVRGNGHTYQVYAVGDFDNEYNDTTLTVENNSYFEYMNDYGTIPCRQSNGNLMTNTPVKGLDCANKKYVDESVANIDIGDIDVDVTNKVDKIPSNESKILADIKGSLGAYVSNTNYEGDFLARVHYNWEPYTIPYRLASGQIHVGMSGWDEINGVSKIFQGSAVPQSYFNMVRTILENNITNVKIVAETANTNANNALTNANIVKSVANNALTEANSKKLTSSYTKAKTTLDYNSLYILWSNSGNTDIELYNSATGARVKDTASENLPSAKVAVLFLPTSSTEVTSAGISKDVSRRCLYFGVTGTPSILNMNVTSKQFVVDSGDLYFTPSSSGVSVFKIAL